MTQRYNAATDRLAMLLSGVCIVHCLAIPLLVVSGHLLGGLVETDAHFHEIMLAVLLPVSVVAFALGYWRHRSRGIVLRGVLGLAIVIAAVSLGHHYLPLLAESALNIAGSIVLLIAHRDNVRHAREPVQPAT